MQLEISPDTILQIRDVLLEALHVPAGKPNIEPLLTLEEAADYLKVAPKTLEKWAKAKRLAYFKPGATGNLDRSAARPRFRVSDIENFLQSKRVEPVRVSLHKSVRRA